MTLEKITNTSKTETSTEFKQMEMMTDQRGKLTSKLLSSVQRYCKQHDRKEVDGFVKRVMPIEAIGASMMVLASNTEGNLSRVLQQVGQTEEKMGDAQLAYYNSLQDGMVGYLTNYTDQHKDYVQLKKKLESRRLKFDCQVNEVQKSKIQNAETEERLQYTQDKYEETLQEMMARMEDLNGNQTYHINRLKDFVQVQKNYYLKNVQMLEQLEAKLENQGGAEEVRSVGGLANVHGRMTTKDRSRTLDDLSPVESQQLQDKGRSASANYDGGSQSSYNSQPTIPRNDSGVVRNDSKFSVFEDPIVQSPPQLAPKPSGGVSVMVNNFNSSAKPMVPTPLHKAGPQKLKVLFDFDAEHPNEMSIRKGEFLTLISENSSGWWKGKKSSGLEGIFPYNYCEKC